MENVNCAGHHTYVSSVECEILEGSLSDYRRACKPKKGIIQCNWCQVWGYETSNNFKPFLCQELPMKPHGKPIYHNHNQDWSDLRRCFTIQDHYMDEKFQREIIQSNTSPEAYQTKKINSNNYISTIPIPQFY